MRIIETKDYEEMSRRGAQLIAAQILQKPKSVLGLATGSTPEGIYRHLIRWHREEGLDFSGVSSVNLDEYKGLAPDHPQSYRCFMETKLFGSVNIPRNQTHVPNGLASDERKECRRYESLIAVLRGIDLQLLGLGNNGHIGFNEPDAFFTPETHCVTLSQSTIDANQRFFPNPEDVPKQAYTMGIRAIMQAKKVLLVAAGKAKAPIVRKAFWGPITPQVPASILQLHPNFTLLCDAKALSEAG